MPLNSDRKLKSVSALTEEANAAVRTRPDLYQTEDGRQSLENAWKVGPAAVVALCLMGPTPEKLTEAEKEKQNELRFREIKITCARAYDVKQALEGAWGDSTRREVYKLVRESMQTIDTLDNWHRTRERGERVSEREWVKVRDLAETREVKELLVSTNNLVEQAIAEVNARINARKARRKKP